MSKVVHQLKENELKEIEELFEKKIALENLLKIVTQEEDEARYQKLLADYGKQCRLFQEWWDRMNQTYSWGQGNFYVDFHEAQVIAQ